MNETKTLEQATLKYRDTIRIYCLLAAQPSLSDEDALIMEAILERATTSPVLSFLIDEADHLLAHQCGLMDESFVQRQQAELGQVVDEVWIDELLLDLKTHLQKGRREELQKFLSAQGVYHGSIDGVCGPQTQAAIAALKAGASSPVQHLHLSHLQQSADC